MGNDEFDTCPRCGKFFACKKDQVTNCQCIAVKLTEAERHFIARYYSGCLCAACMLAEQTTYKLAQSKGHSR